MTKKVKSSKEDELKEEKEVFGEPPEEGKEPEEEFEPEVTATWWSRHQKEIRKHAPYFIMACILSLLSYGVGRNSNSPDTAVQETSGGDCECEPLVQSARFCLFNRDSCDLYPEEPVCEAKKLDSSIATELCFAKPTEPFIGEVKRPSECTNFGPLGLIDLAQLSGQVKRFKPVTEAEVPSGIKPHFEVIKGLDSMSSLTAYLFIARTNGWNTEDLLSDPEVIGMYALHDNGLSDDQRKAVGQVLSTYNGLLTAYENEVAKIREQFREECEGYLRKGLGILPIRCLPVLTPQTEEPEILSDHVVSQGCEVFPNEPVCKLPKESQSYLDTGSCFVSLSDVRFDEKAERPSQCTDFGPYGLISLDQLGGESSGLKLITAADLPENIRPYLVVANGIDARSVLVTTLIFKKASDRDPGELLNYPGMLSQLQYWSMTDNPLSDDQREAVGQMLTLYNGLLAVYEKEIAGLRDRFMAECQEYEVMNMNLVPVRCLIVNPMTL